MDIKAYFDVLKGIDEDWKRAKFFQPSTDEQINNFEKEHAIEIPKSYEPPSLFSFDTKVCYRY